MTAKNTMRNHAVFVALLEGKTYEDIAALFQISVARAKAIHKAVSKDLLAYMKTPATYMPSLTAMRKDKHSWLRAVNQFYNISD